MKQCGSGLSAAILKIPHSGALTPLPHYELMRIGINTYRNGV